MNEEEIKEYLKRTDKLLDKLSGEDKDTLEWLIFGYNQCAKMLYEKENIIKEVRELVEGRKEHIEELSWVEMKVDDYIEEQDELLEILDKAGDSNERNKDNK